MSWLSEIAGKAEDLLNKVDKTTAVVLQNKQSNNSSIPLNYSGLNQPLPTFSGVESRTTQSFKAYGSSSYSLVPSKQAISDRSNKSHSSFIGLKKGPVSDDEKLLEYLNSSEPVLPELRKKSMRKKEDVYMNNKSDNGQSDATPGTSSQKLPVDIDDIDSSVKEDIMQEESKTVSNSTSDGSEDTKSEESQQNWEQDDSEQNKFSSTKADQQTAWNKSEYQNFQASGEDRNIRELQDREYDLIAALDAKDSQLAVLKVRLEEADQEIINKTAILEELKSENERLLKDYNDGLSNHSQTIENLRHQLFEKEEQFIRAKEECHAVQNEHLLQMSRLDDEKRQLAENITNLQKRIAELSDRNRDTTFHLNSANRNLENLHQEYNDYKLRAQRILQSKEKLISSLKDGNFDVKQSPTDTSYAVLSAETEGIKQERDLLREELRKAMESIETYRNEVHELEKMAQNDCETAREHCRNLEEQLQHERMLKEEVQQLNNQLKEEISFLQEEITRSKNTFSNRIQDREIEIEKLRKQLMAKSLSTVSQDELESRLHALTENLIQKQTIVEALSTEKNSLVLQLERLEQQLKEAQVYGAQHHAVIGVNTTESERKQKSSLFIENPFDSNLTRNAKKVYGSIDAFSIRLGVFFRRYPVARLFVFMYMMILHVWVMIVLLTYEPEIHGPSYKPDGKK